MMRPARPTPVASAQDISDASQRAVQERFDAALLALLERVKQDRTILAAILRGSLARESVWEKSDIDLALITIDGVTNRQGDLSLDADGIHVHTCLLTRSDFRKAAQSAGGNSFAHSVLVKGRLLYTHDQSIGDLLARVQSVGDRDTQANLLMAAYHAAYRVYKGHKFFLTGDLEYAAFMILMAANSFARIEVLNARLVADRELLPKAVKLNPAFFKIVYLDILNTRKTPKSVRAALRAMDEYLERRTNLLFGPIFEYLQEVGEARSSTEIEHYFLHNLGVPGATLACEYLADQHKIGKTSLPVQLTKRSNISMDESAFFYLSDSAGASEQRNGF